MAMVTDSLQLYLKMNEIKDNTHTPDNSGHGRHGTLKGGVKLVDDDVFDQCLDFPIGSGPVTVADAPPLRPTGELTASAWIMLADDDDEIRRSSADIVIFRKEPHFELFIWGEKNTTYLKSKYRSPMYNSMIISERFLNPGKLPEREARVKRNKQWYHIAITVSRYSPDRFWTTFYIYDKNQDISTSGGSVTSLGRRGDEPPHSPFEIITGHYLSYRIAHVRFYNRALAKDEIQQNIATDLTENEIEQNIAADLAEAERSAFRAEYPVDFSLYDDDQQSVLYIDNGPKGANGATGYPLHLELHNRSGRDITFEKAADPQATDPNAPPKATAENHHLELQFRAGTLSSNTLQALKEAKVKIEERSWENTTSAHAAWDLRVADPQSGVPVSLYLLRQGPAQVLAADSRCVLSLTPMAADAGQGARGAQVTLKFKQMTYAKPEGSPVVADRTKQLYIGHYGRRNVPLHVGFLGPNSNRISISQDHPELRKLTLGITNTHPKNAIVSQSGAKATLILKFDYGSQPWDLCSGEAAKSVKVSRKWPAETEDTPVPPFERGQAEKPEWHINLPDNGLQPGERVEVQIDFAGILHAKSGDINLYVDYENLPGYGEGRFICTVTCSPLMCTDSGVDIHGGLTVSPRSGDSSKITSAGEIQASKITSAGEIHASEIKAAQLTVDGPVSTGDAGIRWKLVKGELGGKWEDQYTSHEKFVPPQSDAMGWIFEKLKEVFPDPDKIVRVTGRLIMKFHTILGTELTKVYPINITPSCDDLNRVVLTPEQNPIALQLVSLGQENKYWRLIYHKTIFEADFRRLGQDVSGCHVKKKSYVLMIVFTPD
jgi:hypothetical protein